MMNHCAALLVMAAALCTASFSPPRASEPSTVPEAAASAPTVTLSCQVWSLGDGELRQKLDAGEYQWPFFLGTANLQGDRDAAREHFERAMELRADYAPLPCYVGRILLESEVRQQPAVLGVEEAQGKQHQVNIQVELAAGNLFHHRPTSGSAGDPLQPNGVELLHLPVPP